VAPKKPHAKGSKQLCAALLFIADQNLKIADEEREAGNDDASREAIEVASDAMDDYSKWRCSESKRAMRARKQMSVLARPTKRGRRPARSRR
jgi:hypothetical protein